MTSRPTSAANDPGVEATERAIVELYERTYNRVARYIALRIGKTYEAEDLASEVFVRALRKAPAYRDTGKPMEAWIFRIAHNLAVDHLRKQDRRHLQLEAISNLASNDSAHGHLEQEMELTELKQAVAQLPPAEKEVVSLRFGAGLRADEVAQALGKKPTTVRWLQHSAVGRLRSIMLSGIDGEHASGRSAPE